MLSDLLTLRLEQMYTALLRGYAAKPEVRLSRDRTAVMRLGAQDRHLCVDKRSINPWRDDLSHKALCLRLSLCSAHTRHRPALVPCTQHRCNC